MNLVSGKSDKIVDSWWSMPDHRLFLNPPQVSAQSRLDCQPLPVSIETTSASLGADLEVANHSASTISTPHWWAPIREKQLSVALSSFDGWLGRWSMVVANRNSTPWPWCQFYWPGQVGVISRGYYHLSLIPYTEQCVQIPISIPCIFILPN